MNRRNFLKTAAYTGLGLGLAPGVFAKKQSLRFGYLPITDATPLLAAHALGYFAREGLNVERPVMLRSWSALTESFLAGKFDLTHMLFPIPIWMRFRQKIPVKVLAWDHTNGSALTVGKNSGIKNFSDLGGKRVALPSWYSMHNLILQMALTKNELSPLIRTNYQKPNNNQVHLVTLPPPEMPTALLSGKIDGFMVADPFNALAQIRLQARIMRYTSDIWKNHPCCVIVAGSNLVNQKPVLVQKAINAIVRAQAWCKNNPGETAHLLSRNGEKYLPFPEEILLKVFESHNPKELVHPHWNSPRIGFAPYPYPSATEFIIDRMKQTLVEGNTEFLSNMDTNKAVEELVDDRFVKKAINDMGLTQTFHYNDTNIPFKREEIIEI